MRRPDWPQRLDTVLRDALTRTFRYGAFDCCLLAADAVHAMTGDDPAARFRGYRGRRAAERIVAESGGLRGLVSACLGMEPCDAFPRRGDVVLLPHDAGEVLGVAIGVHCAVPTNRGLEFLPARDRLCTWRID